MSYKKTCGFHKNFMIWEIQKYICDLHEKHRQGHKTHFLVNIDKEFLGNM